MKPERDWYHLSPYLSTSLFHSLFHSLSHSFLPSRRAGVEVVRVGGSTYTLIIVRNINHHVS